MAEEIQIKVKHVWIAVGVIVLIGLVFALKSFGLPTGFGIKDVGEDVAQENLLNFFATQVPESTIDIISSEKQENFYMFNLSFDGEPYPVYVTLDGKFMSPGIIQISD